MMSFVEFKRHVLEAFDGEPVTVEVDRSGSRWSLVAKAFEGGVEVYDTTNALECPDRDAARRFALGHYASLAWAVDEAEKMRTNVSASAQNGR